MSQPKGSFSLCNFDAQHGFGCVFPYLRNLHIRFWRTILLEILAGYVGLASYEWESCVYLKLLDCVKLSMVSIHVAE